VELGPKTALLVSQINTIEYVEVGSELEALLLESRLIKKFKPKYNIISKDDKSPYYIHITREDFPRPVINHEPSGSVAGPFLSGLIPKRLLRNFRRIAPYCLASRPVKKPCFYSHLGLCSPCPGSGSIENIKSLYRNNISRLKSLLSGNFIQVRSQLKKDMQTASLVQDYEKASTYRDYIQSLEYLISPPTGPEEYLANPNLISDRRSDSLLTLSNALSPFVSVPSLTRIEMIDIAHLSGTAASASLVVAVDGQLRHDLYRHFNIKNSPTDSDVDMMKEIVTRRLLRNDWPFPDLLVLDGGIPQLSVLKNIRPDFPVISLAKQQEIIVIPFNDGFQEVKLPQNNSGLQLLQRLRDEAHRFSRRLHHVRRSRDLTRS
jgi:excinuclease ABC subunit C